MQTFCIFWMYKSFYFVIMWSIWMVKRNTNNKKLINLDETGMRCVCNTQDPSRTDTDTHIQPVTKLSNSHQAKTMLKPNKAALWSLLPDTANYQYSISILSGRGNRGINFRPLCFPSSLSWNRLCLLTNLLSCFDHKCDYHHTRDNKTPYLCCTKEHELKPKL